MAAVGYPTRIESHWLQVEKVEVPIAGLPPQLDGLRIVQLSDLHLSAVAPLKYIQRAVTRAQNLAGDLVVLTGDYITDDADQAVACASALASLHAPLGVYAILGNHDHWTDPQKVAGALAGAGLTVLRNQGRAIFTLPGPKVCRGPTKSRRDVGVHQPRYRSGSPGRALQLPARDHVPHPAPGLTDPPPHRGDRPTFPPTGGA